MSNAIFTLILFSISSLEAHNFERIDLVLSNDYVFKRVKPNDQIILNGVHVEYQNIIHIHYILPLKGSVIIL